MTKFKEATGTITAVEGAVTIDCGNSDSISVVLTGTWAATVTPEVSVNGVDFVATGFINKDTDAIVATVTANGSFQILETAGTRRVRVRASAYTSGTVTVTMIGGGAGPDQRLVQVVPGTAAADLGKAEDAAHASGDTGTMMLARRIDTAASSAGTSGDYATVDTDGTGRLRVATPGPAASVDVNTALAADADLTVAAATGLRLVGVAYRESAGTAAVATFRILNGSIASGTEIMPIEIAANDSHAWWFWPGIDAANGLSIDMIAGTVDVDLFTITVT